MQMSVSPHGLQTIVQSRTFSSVRGTSADIKPINPRTAEAHNFAGDCFIQHPPTGAGANELDRDGDNRAALSGAPSGRPTGQKTCAVEARHMVMDAVVAGAGLTATTHPLASMTAVGH